MNEKNEELTYDGLMASEGIEDLSIEAALERIGRLVDSSGDLKREEGTACVLAWCDALE